MPHLSVEYSANLDGRVDIGTLCERLLEATLGTSLFEAGAVRVRAIRCEHYAIADRRPENAFVDLNFRIGRGRSSPEKKRAGEAIFAAAQEVLEPLFDSPHFALSLEIREIDPDLSWKRNAMHARLRNSADHGKKHDDHA
jgi:5-carboxymethyl-2-hydroxymuconate isomerase